MKTIIPNFIAAFTLSMSPFSVVKAYASVTPTPVVFDQVTEQKIEEAQKSIKPVWVVKQGETLVSIAKNFYGSEYHWATLWNDNPDILDPLAPKVGFVLKLRSVAPFEPEKLKTELSRRLSPTPSPIPIKSRQTVRYVAPITSSLKVNYISSDPTSFASPLGSYKYISTKFTSYHPGVDYSAEYGTPIRAASDGIVVESGWSRIGYGKTVVIQHSPSSYSRYGHLSTISVTNGAYVKQGSRIGAVGCTGRCTGSHLHFEIYKNGRAQNPVNLVRK